MNWKYTVFGTGATALATLLATTTPGRLGDTGTAQRPPEAPSAAQAVDVQREADRLGVRLGAVPRYEAPTRDLFRFASRRAPAAVPQPAAEPPAPPPVERAVPSPPMVLIGTAADGGAAGSVTAILSTPGGVLLVREGDVVAPDYRVAKVTADTVTLESPGAPPLALELGRGR
jgi:hypothetical protein